MITNIDSTPFKSELNESIGLFMVVTTHSKINPIKIPVKIVMEVLFLSTFLKNI